VLSTLDVLVRAGKVRYAGVSNYPGWQLMKSLAVSDRYGWPRYLAHQVYYCLVGRPYPHFPYQRQEGFARLNPAA
jgi:aryl-alcohol dehydrogenase-like predicted oxidoreductase